jgi:hypothetical protein
MPSPARRRLVLFRSAPAAAAPPAGIGTPTSLGSISNATGNNTRQLSGLTVPAGALIVVLVVDHGGAAGAGTAVAISDTAGNTYSASTEFVDSSGGLPTMIRYCANASALSSGTITAVFGTADATGKTVHAAYVTGIATASPVDIQVVANAGATASPSVATGTLAQASEVIFGAVIMAGGSADTFTEDTPEFTNLSRTQTVDLVNLAAKVVSATTDLTYNPTNSNSRHQAAKVISFKGA